MTTEKQIQANRANAQRSTGPRTANGKRRSAQNALKHGLTAATPVLPDEDPAAFQALRDRMFSHFDPISHLEEELVEDLVSVLWRLRRVPAIESTILQTAAFQAHMTALGELAREIGELGGSVPAPFSVDEQGKLRFGVSEEASPEGASLDGPSSDGPSGVPLSIEGFMHDAEGPNLLEKLGRHERRLENRFHRLLRELERLQGQRVSGAVVESTSEQEE